MRPTVLVVDDELANRLFVATVLATDWHVVEAADGHDAVAKAREITPDLVVMDIDMPNADGWMATDAIRAEPSPLASVPILAYTSLKLDHGQILARGMDGRLPKPCAPDMLRDAIAPWRPSAELPGQRLADLFGADQMDALVSRFRDQLIEALALFDVAGEAAAAHRIAGVAGTLGFSNVSDSWLRLSEGDDSARGEARRDARLAVAAIDRKLACIATA